MLPHFIGSRRSNRLPWARGFTLVELLVVIAIIGILVSLLLPAVNSAREAARRVQCQNNIRQLALAVLNYDSAQKELPPAGQWGAGVLDKNFNYTGNIYGSWAVLVLPYLEEQALYDKVDDSVPMTDPVNRIVRGTPIPMMQCPSGSRHAVFYDGSAVNESAGVHADNWARGNYAASGPNAALGGAERWEWTQGEGAQRKGVFLWSRLDSKKKSTLRQIKDGLSHTIMLSEVKVGITEKDLRGSWAHSGLGSSLAWHGWHEGSVGRANGPNDCTPSSDDFPGCFEMLFQVGFATVDKECMPCKGSVGAEGQMGTRSSHTGGVFSVFCDASVHFISDDIQTSQFCCSVWDRLILSSDGLPVAPSDF